MDPVRVLFVDDEEELVTAVVERLQLRGIRASGATSGSDALKKVEENGFEVLVLDVRMPGMGGFDVIRKIKHEHPDIEVVLLSGHGSTEDVDEGLRLGAFDYLQKPVDIEHLVDIIRRAAALHR
jgi:two-component system, OmpR family, response regulator CpxR